MAARYRDTKTGRLVSKETWKRSRARGGKRYKRETSKPRIRKENTRFLVSLAYDSGESSFKADFVVNDKLPNKLKTDTEIENFLTEKIADWCRKNGKEWITDHTSEIDFTEEGERNSEPKSIELREVHRSGKKRRTRR
jgi:hypothetical protein